VLRVTALALDPVDCEEVVDRHRAPSLPVRPGDRS
jgi:hypothetical protein